ncbi:RDD family protein [Microlunatus parietis]|uniref:Putative RDD family membrane protein YckC n=1 Tax=Microlunatus parietis TaxID=682979 RepID=A0A7Y9I321_9ACTN|nr:RDD family protein [Microlunatus parietis]NYE69311.1 putative RDD family membrane protein YckC [Microlunatus parietis]
MPPGPPAPAAGQPYPLPFPPRPQLRTDYASWGKRVGANLIDTVPSMVYLIFFMIGYVNVILSLFASIQNSGTYSPNLSDFTLWIVVVVVLWLIALGWNIYNRWITAGRTGQSLGKRLMKIKLIGEQTGQPIGAGYAFLRDLVHIVDGAAYIGYLWPLWDEKRQTFADKLMQTIVVDEPAPQTGPVSERPTGP